MVQASPYDSAMPSRLFSCYQPYLPSLTQSQTVPAPPVPVIPILATRGGGKPTLHIRDSEYANHEDTA
jgi:hypothetical protein